MEKNKITFFRAFALFFTRFSDFEGRSSRKEYWVGFFAFWLYAFFGLLVVSMAEFVTENEICLSIIAALATGVIFLPWISLHVRRFRDVGHSFLTFSVLLIVCVVLGSIFIATQIHAGTTMCSLALFALVVYSAYVCGRPSKPLQKRD